MIDDDTDDTEYRLREANEELEAEHEELRERLVQARRSIEGLRDALDTLLRNNEERDTPRLARDVHRMLTLLATQAAEEALRTGARWLDEDDS